MQQNTKSATTAGLLGIFLGSFGAHNWYLGEKSKGIAHVCMMSGGLLIEIVASIILPSVLSLSALLSAAAFLAILTSIAAAAMSASGIWGLVEGIIILTQGDAGLARKGYAVATPVMPQNYGPQPMNNGYAQPMNNGYTQPMNNGYTQPMNNGYAQPMNNGYAQPMNNGYTQPMDNNMNNNMGNMNNGANNMPNNPNNINGQN